MDITPPEFNKSIHYLGSLCKQNHRFQGKNYSLRYGNSGHCIECLKEARKRRPPIPGAGRTAYIRLKADPVRVQSARENLKRYQERNREMLREKARIRYHKNRDRELARERQKRKDNPEKARKIARESKQKLRREHPELEREYAREYYQKNTLRIRLRNRLVKAFKMFTETGKQCTAKDYGLDFQAIIDYLGPCPGERFEWHIDHIRPLSSFDFNDTEQVRQAFDPKNHQWLPKKKNLSKGNRYASEG